MLASRLAACGQSQTPAAPAKPAETKPAEAAKPADAAPTGPLPPVAEDVALAPADWFARIRERWRAGDHDGARASLRLLRETHPELAIPADLAPLLR